MWISKVPSRQFRHFPSSNGVAGRSPVYCCSHGVRPAVTIAVRWVRSTCVALRTARRIGHDTHPPRRTTIMRRLPVGAVGQVAVMCCASPRLPRSFLGNGGRTLPAADMRLIRKDVVILLDPHLPGEEATRLSARARAADGVGLRCHSLHSLPRTSLWLARGGPSPGMPLAVSNCRLYQVRGTAFHGSLSRALPGPCRRARWRGPQEAWRRSVRRKMSPGRCRRT